MIALNARTGELVRSFGKDGVVDLKVDNDQEYDLTTAAVGLNATPLIAGDVVVVGAAHFAAGSPNTRPTAKGYVRGFDVKTGKRLWIFHTIPLKGELGYDTWLDGSAERNGNLGAWAQMSADLELGLVYVPTEMPATEAPAADAAAATDTAPVLDTTVAPAEDTASVAASAAKATEVVDNPYGLGALWAQGDFVAKGTLIIMVIMSAFTWYILVTKLWEQQRLMSQGSASR